MLCWEDHLKFSSLILPATVENDSPVIVYNFSAQDPSYTHLPEEVNHHPNRWEQFSFTCYSKTNYTGVKKVQVQPHEIRLKAAEAMYEMIADIVK
ncbi:MAG: hypothetical protein ABIQ74_02940 [Chitinophagales bacterium]